MSIESESSSDLLNYSIINNLFFGKIPEDAFFPYPAFSQDQKEMAKEMCNAIKKYCDDHVDSADIDDQSLISNEIYQGLAELGLYGLGVSEKFGGMGLDTTLYARVFAQVAHADGSLAVMLGAHQSIGYKGLVLYGSEKQKTKYLPSLTSGEKLAAFCLTEPSSGSDAYSIKTKALQDQNGDFLLSGQKLWITNAGRADFYTVFCKTDHMIDGNSVEKISCMIVEKGMQGLSFGEKENKMGIRASETRAVYFDKVKVPKENVLGELGKGFKIAMNVLNSGRLSLGSGCTGAMKKILKIATEHATNRKQFDRSISEFGLIQEKLSNIAAMIYASESTVYMTTGLIDKGLKEYHLESAICKVLGSEFLWDVVDMALQIAAGSGYMREYPYERILRDSRINLIFEGTNEILRCFIALSGIRGPSEKLKDLGKMSDVSSALLDPIKSLGVLTDFALSRLSKMIGPDALTMHHHLLNKEASYIPTMVGDFSLAVEKTLIKFGHKIIDNELPLKRIADMVIQLYVSLSVISRTTYILEKNEVSQDDKDYVLNLAKIALKKSRKTFIASIKGMDKNQDKRHQALSDAVVKKGGYGLDIIDY